MAARSRVAAARVALLALSFAITAGGDLRAEPAIRPAYQPVQTFSRSNGVATPDAALHVAVVGAVRSPGVFRTGRPLTLTQAIEAAGGADGDASGTVHVVRKGRLLQDFYQPGSNTAAAGQIGPLLDGDVVVMRPQRGVRTAHYVTPAAGAGGQSPATGVQNASRPQLVHVACVGITDRPVVLPLLPEEATQKTLLSDMLGLPTTGVPQGAVSILPSAGGVPADGSLTDGMVLLFDARKLDVRRLKPVEGYPPAKELPASLGESQSQAVPVETHVPAATEPLLTAAPAPGVPFLVYADGAATSATQAPPSPLTIPEQTLTPAASVGTAPSSFLTAPTVTPSPPLTALPPAVLSATPPVETGAQKPVDVTGASPGPAVREIVVHGPHQPTSYERAATAPARVPSAESARLLSAENAPTGVHDFPHGGAAPTTGAAPGPKGLSQVLPIAAATFVTALACLAGSYFWSRRTQGKPISAAPPPVAAAHAETAARSSLDELLENRLPVTVESPAERRPARFHGKTIGRKRLMIDASHAGVERPHFDVSASASRRAARRERSEQHLAAALAPRRAQRDQAVVSKSAQVQYDVVQPEPAADPAGPHSASRRRTVATDALARALSSLQEDRT